MKMKQEPTEIGKKSNNLMKIRFAEIRDVKAIQSLADIFYFLMTQPARQLILRKRILVAEEDDKVIGVVIYTLKENKVSVIVVDKEYRGKGIGKALFEESVKIFKVKQMKILATEDPTNSIPFWKKMGFYPLPEVVKTKRGNRMRPMIYIKEEK